MADSVERLNAALVDRYVVERELGSGGMATVYLAQDLRHHRPVALKVLDPDVAAAVGAERFLREIETVANLIHPHILPLFDSGQADGLLFYVMPYVEGESLQARLDRERPLPADQGVQIAREIADALAYAHDHGVIHRDVKPGNILLESGHAVLADFGVAHAVAGAKSERITKTGMFLGTPTYMSPEQAAGDEELDGRSDQYALACVLFEMLSGDPPFTASTPMGNLAKHMTSPPPSLGQVRPDLPRHLARVIRRALAKEPADRFPTASDFADALAGGSVGAVRVMRRFPERGGLLRWAAVLAVAAAAVVVWFWLQPPLPALDPNRLVLYPLDVSGELGPDEADRGEDSAYLIWVALAGRGSLGWLDAVQLLGDADRASNISSLERRELAMAHGAGWYLHGRLILSGDQAQAYLQLHDVATDSIVARADTSGTRAEASQLGVRAVGRLLVELMPEETVDVSAVAGREPDAIQTLLRAERHFHAGRFEQAYEAYGEAVGQDSAFALAAVKGAQAASWLHRGDDAVDLVGVALEHAGSLAPRDYLFARGWEAFIEARADSAIHYFEQAIAVDDQWPEAWTGLAEVYNHLLPRRAPQDSLARDAFRRVLDQTNHSAPALFHLVEFAIRDRDLERASRLMEEYRVASPDTAGYGMRKLELMLQCAQDPSAPSEWGDQVLADVEAVLEAARALGVGGSHASCAVDGYRTVLAHDTSTPGAWRFAAAVGLQSMLAATGRTEELKAFLDSTPVYPTSLRPHYIVDALAGISVEDRAEALAEELRGDVAGPFGWRMWYLGVWDAHRGRLDEARAVRDTMRSRAQQTGARQTSLIAASLRAHVALAEGDTATALRLLDALSPTVRRGSLYRPWESLGLERLLQARLLLARGRHADAFREASTFDSPGAANLVLPTFLPASLQIRLEAARALGDLRAAERMESRLSALRR